jgi:Xaa-Pro aminopeptidase
MKTGRAKVIYAASDESADILYATRFFAPDAFLFLEQDGHRTILLSDLEVDRGRRTAAVDEVVAYSDVSDRIRTGTRIPPVAEVLAAFLKDRKVRSADVPRGFPLGIAQALEKRGVTLRASEGIFWPGRETKSAEELESIRAALKITEAGMARAMEVLREAKISGVTLRWGGKRLTAELLRTEIDSAVLRAGGLAKDTIVACGDQGCDPHERGSGPLRPNALIIIDVFPRDPHTGYYGDLTRTVVRGRASEAQRALWETVLKGQKLALEALRPGVSGKKVQEKVKRFFSESGYPTEKREGCWSGFFHGLGHGLGLELHEEPRLAAATLKMGHVFTVEPGLYYRGVGGVRHEDVVTITADGVRMLSRFAKPLEL